MVAVWIETRQAGRARQQLHPPPLVAPEDVAVIHDMVNITAVAQVKPSPLWTSQTPNLGVNLIVLVPTSARARP